MPDFLSYAKAVYDKSIIIKIKKRYGSYNFVYLLK